MEINDRGVVAEEYIVMLRTWQSPTQTIWGGDSVKRLEQKLATVPGGRYYIKFNP